MWRIAPHIVVHTRTKVPSSELVFCMLPGNIITVTPGALLAWPAGACGLHCWMEEGWVEMGLVGGGVLEVRRCGVWAVEGQCILEHRHRYFREREREREREMARKRGNESDRNWNGAG